MMVKEDESKFLTFLTLNKVTHGLTNLKLFLSILLLHEAERGFSHMRYLYPWLRSSMTTERPNGLALMTINPDRLAKITDEDILKSFVEAKP